MIEAFRDSTEENELRRKFRYLAWRRYGIPRADAEDVVQATFVSYLQVKHRYEEEENQIGILYGIFRNKCREFLDRRRRERERLKDYAQNHTGQAGEPILTPGKPAPSNGIDDDLIQAEDGERIREALDRLRPEARELLLLFAGLGRKRLLDRLDVNKNTLDSRLHVYRKELMKILRRMGIRP